MATQVCVGGNHVALVTADGLLFTWGRGSAGQLGHGKGTVVKRAFPMSLCVPHVVEDLTSCEYVTAGADTTLVRTRDGKVYGFGCNSAAQIALPVTHSVFTGGGGVITEPSLLNALIPPEPASSWQIPGMDLSFPDLPTFGRTDSDEPGECGAQRGE